MLDNNILFPPPEEAEQGILAIGGDLSVERLLEAYRQGIFPWYNEQEPIIWWSPEERFVLFLDDFHLSGSMRRVLNSGKFSCTADTAFSTVIRHCAQVVRKGEQGTWITPEMEAAYIRLYEAGWAHSIEVWEQGRIVGGLYGVSIGKCFFAESMFHLSTNASKYALAKLVALLREKGFTWLDAQVYSDHMKSLGASSLSRDEFLRLLRRDIVKEGFPGKWSLD